MSKWVLLEYGLLIMALASLVGVVLSQVLTASALKVLP